MNKRDSAEKTIRDIRRATRRWYSAEEKIRIVLEGRRGESSIAELCRKEGINQSPLPLVDSDEVKELRSEAAQLKKSAGRDQRHAPDRLLYFKIAPKTDFLPILCKTTATLAPLSSLHPRKENLSYGE